jgi:hypothetical protein
MNGSAFSNIAQISASLSLTVFESNALSRIEFSASAGTRVDLVLLTERVAVIAGDAYPGS